MFDPRCWYARMPSAALCLPNATQKVYQEKQDWTMLTAVLVSTWRLLIESFLPGCQLQLSRVAQHWSKCEVLTQPLTLLPCCPWWQQQLQQLCGGHEVLLWATALHPRIGIATRILNLVSHPFTNCTQWANFLWVSLISLQSSPKATMGLALRPPTLISQMSLQPNA